MSSQFRITIPGKPWTKASNNIQGEIQTTNARGDDFPITKIFEYITLTDSNRDLEDKIKKRGAFERQPDGTYQNRGVPISRAVHDIHQDIGRVAIYFPREVSVLLSQDLIVSVDEERRRRVVLSFRDKPPTAGFGRRFTLQRVMFAEDGVSYDFQDQSDDSRTLTLYVDFSKEPQQIQQVNDAAIGRSVLSPLSSTKGAQSASILSNAAFSDGACICCNPIGEPVEPCHDPGGNLIVRIHAKILIEPNVLIDTQVASINMVYGDEIECILASREELNTEALRIEHLEDYDAGECSTPGETGEFDQISIYRANATELDIVVYWVRSITSDTSGSLAGCATYRDNKPTCVLNQTGSQWVLAHELGHILGLNHPCEHPDCSEELRTRLMFPDDDFSGTPAIIDEELKQMRCSRYTVTN
ncbi:MAG: hypothetical protein AB2689_05415 [Candidatus Thiodiazotropha taylori]